MKFKKTSILVSIGLSSFAIFLSLFSTAQPTALLLTEKAQVLVADSRDGQFVFGIIGDGGDWNSKTQITLNSMIKEGVNRLILPGDNLYDTSSTYAAHWNPWKERGFVFDLVAIGNHNIGYSKEMAFFGMPSQVYSRVIPNTARFIVLNSDNLTANVEQAKFLESELISASEPLIFVVYHHPSLTIAKNAHVWTDKKSFQLAIRPLIVKYQSKITAVLNGHDHIASLIHFDSLPVVVSGAAQSIYDEKPIDQVQEGIHVKTAFFFDQTNTWTKLTISARERGVAVVDFIRSKDNEKTCSARITTGKPAELGANCLKNSFRAQKAR